MTRKDLPFDVGDVILLDDRERTVVDIDLVPRMGSTGWVRFASGSADLWFCIDYVIEHGKNLKYIDTPLHKLLQGDDDDT